MSEPAAPGAVKPTTGRFAWPSSRIMLAVVLAATFVMRARMLAVPLGRDEGVYAYIGRLILQGIPLYTSSVDLQMPGLWILYAAAMALFGQSPTGIHLGLLVVNVISVWLTFLLGKRLLGEVEGVVAAAGFASLSLCQKMLGFTANAEHFILVFALAGMLLLLRALDSSRARDLFFSGLLMGLCLAVKQQGVFFAGFAGSYLFYALAREGPVLRRSNLTKLALFASGALAPFLLFTLWFAVRGVLDEFFFWSFRYSSSYGTGRILAAILDDLQSAGLPILSHTAVFCVLALIGLLRGAPGPALDVRDRSRTVFLLGFAAFSVLAICPGWYFRHHYFLLLTPATALLAAAGVGAIRRGAAGPHGGWANATTAVLTLLAVGQLAVAERDFWFQYEPEEIGRNTYRFNPVAELQEIGQFIERNTAPDEPIAVLGSEPQVYLYAHRNSATKLIVMYPMMWAPKEMALALQRQTIQEIETAAPKYLLFMSASSSWGLRTGSERLIIDWAEDHARRHYRLVGMVDIDYPNPSVFVWGQEARSYVPSSFSYIRIFERKSPPEANS